jgi:cytochrome c oxidase subunit I
VLAMSLLLVIAERFLGVPIFSPSTGGDPLLFQHLFWFYSHPAVYIMILPAMGVISEVITCFARRRVFGYVGMVFSLMAIAVIGFMVWGHHMFVSGQSPYASLVFSFLSFIVAVPSAIKVFNWTATLYRGHISFEAPMLYAIAFIGLFTVGGLTGLFLASVPIDIQAHATYFVIAHFHFIMVGGSVTGFFAGLHYWWPKITGKMYHELWARVAAITTFLGFMLTFMPQYIMGWFGMPRRYHHYDPVFQIWHVMSTGGAMVLALAYIMPLIYLTWSILYGERASGNPWQATGLEWQTPSPPPKENFEHTPEVTSDPYCYHPVGEPGEAEMAAPHQPQSEDA